MQSATLSQLIRQSFESEIRGTIDLPGSEGGSLPASVIRSIVHAMHDRSVSLAAQDELLMRAIHIYRRSGGRAWSAIVLEMLGPMLADAERSFPFVPMEVTRDDLRQQLIVECLHAARYMKLPDPPRDVQGRVRRLTLRRTAGWLRRVIRGGGEGAEGIELEGPPVRGDDQHFVKELVDSGVSPENLTLLYRSQVLGLTAREIAAQMSISVDAVHMRQRRALDRVRRWAQTQSRRSSGGLSAAA